MPIITFAETLVLAFDVPQTCTLVIFFDEKAEVLISGVENEKINIWHIKNDNTIEQIESKKENKKIEFETESFSTYVIELIEENEKTTVDKQADTETKTETNTVANEITEQVEENKTENNVEQNVTNTTEENTLENNTTPKKDIKAKSIKSPRKAAARNLPDSTLEIDDYESDYYYYMGQNYTDNAAGTNSNTYSDSNLVKVTLNYYGFAQGETDNEKKGRISLDSGEEQDIVKNIRCVPVKNGTVSIELMENPFMDKPTGYGFGGWTASTGTVSKNSNTLTYTLSVSTTSNITVNLYAKWESASVVYVNGETGSDNMGDGLTEETAFGSWESAFKYIYSHNKGDREKNIIVVTGNMDTSINYTRPVTKTVSRPVKSITYHSSTYINTNTTYIMSTSQGVGGNALTASGTSITNTELTNETAPPAGAQWRFTESRRGYYIQNVQTGQYLSCDNNGNLSMGNSRFEWRYDSGDRTFYYYGRRYDFYLSLSVQ